MYVCMYILYRHTWHVYMCMYICIHKRMYSVSIFTFIVLLTSICFINIHISKICVCICVYTHMYTYTCVCTYVYISVYICVM